MISITALTKYDSLAASTRQRFESYRPYLRHVEINLNIDPLLSNQYLQGILSGGNSVRHSVLAQYITRARKLIQFDESTLLWVHCDLFPYLPSCVERLLLRQKRRIVFDFDDAIFHNYDMHRSAFVRAALGRKIDSLMQRSAMVFAGNRYLADRAVSSGASRVEIVPTVVDLNVYRTGRISPPDGKPRIGWIGSPSTWRQYMAPKLPVLLEAASASGALLRVVGSGQGAQHDGLEFLPWVEADESLMIQGMDIGVMPLDDSPWSQGKCGYKLIQYMACGVPVIASPVGVNCDIVQHGVTGFLASTNAEWRAAIDTLMRDPELRHRMGQAGRRRVEEFYSLQVWGPRVATMLRAVFAA